MEGNQWKMDHDKQRESRPYDETVEAAKMLEEISESSARPSPSPKSLQASEQKAVASSEGEADRERGSKQSPSAGGDEPAGTSIGELFSNLVKMSPPDKIRVEKGSIGSLFKKYIEK